MPPFPQRKSPRLQGYDYTQDGAYFITICTFQRQHLFGEISDGEMILTDMGQITHDEIEKITQRRPYPAIDAYVVMPNHVHMILILSADSPVEVSDGHSTAMSLPESGSDDKYLKPGAVGTIIRSYKSAVTRYINQRHPELSIKVWQSRYHDHIIRDEKSLNYIRQYVVYNPAKWEEDIFYAA